MITSTEVLHKLSSEPFWETSDYLLNTKPIVPKMLETSLSERRTAWALFSRVFRRTRRLEKSDFCIYPLRRWSPIARWIHRVPIPSPLPLREGRQVEIIWTRKLPPPPQWDRRVIQRNHIKFRTCSAHTPMWAPPINESGELCILGGL